MNSKKLIRRAVCLASAAVLSVSAVAMFAGCTTDRPEITITYTFNGKDYAVDYTLSRKSAPQTVQHFIELADAGYYNGLCIHNYSSAYLYSGGYTYENGELVEKQYFSSVADLDLTQSVFNVSDEDNPVPLNTVYGEFKANGVTVSGSRYTHTAGALVMYYADKGNDGTRVATIRSSDGEMQYNCEYKYNSATSLFYTFTGTQNTDRDATYCVFGMASDYENQMTGDDGLLTAIEDYTSGLGEDQAFTEEVTMRINTDDPFDSVRNAKLSETFEVPVEPIVIKSVVVNTY